MFLKKEKEVTQSEELIDGYEEITEEEFYCVIDIYSSISQLKWQLAKTDYKCLKHADGELTDEEYEPVKQERHNLRIQIRELEAAI